MEDSCIDGIGAWITMCCSTDGPMACSSCLAAAAERLSSMVAEPMSEAMPEGYGIGALDAEMIPQ